MTRPHVISDDPNEAQAIDPIERHIDKEDEHAVFFENEIGWITP